MFGLDQKFINWLFALDRYKKRLIQITFDGLLASMLFLIAFFMRVESTNYLYQIDTYIGMTIAMISIPLVFAARGQYNSFTRHVSIETANNIAISSGISCAFLLSSILLLELRMPRSVPLIYASLLCLFAVSGRFFVRALGEKMTKEKRENIAIYGTGTDSIQLMEALRKNENYKVRALIDDNPEKYGKNIGGVAISELNKIAKTFKELEIKILLIAVPSDIEVIRKRILELLSEQAIKIKTIPSISSLISGGAKVSELKDIKIEDLLGRKTSETSPELMAKTISGKTVFVTGAGGSIGSELCRQIIQWEPKKLILLDISEYSIYELLKDLSNHPFGQKIDIVPLIGSVQDRGFVKKIFDRFAIHTTYHAAAYKHVPLMEQNVMQCFVNNVFGTLNIAELAIAANVNNFVLVSTDKAVNPTNFMGASKRFSEIICQSLPTEKAETCFSIVRFGNVLGSSGSVVPLFKKQIESGGPVTLTHLDVTRYFMTIAEASQLVIQAGSISSGGDVFVLDMGKPIKILELAERMVALSGLKPVLNSENGLKDDEISITVTGLRPGEKLFEELSYGSNLVGTEHPQIYTTEEVPMSYDALQELLLSVGDAIRDNEHQKLYKIISTVAKGVVDLGHSCDVFIEQHDAKGNKNVPFSRQTKLKPGKGQVKI